MVVIKRAYDLSVKKYESLDAGVVGINFLYRAVKQILSVGEISTEAPLFAEATD